MAIKNRKKTEEYILKYIGKMTTDKDNLALYTKLFSETSDKDFDKFMISLRDGENILQAVYKHFGKNIVSVDKLIDIASELGLDLFTKVNLVSEDGSFTYVPNIEYLVVALPTRRTTQSLDKGIRVADNNRKRDAITGQVTGDSKATKISYPETVLINAIGLENTLNELLVTKGGDLGASAAMNAYLYKYGKVSHKDIEQYATGVESTGAMIEFFRAAHLDIVE